MKPNQFYLEGINPLRGLDQAGLVSRIEQGERGYFALLMWTYRAFEIRDPIVRAVKKRLMSALGALKWDIRLADTGEDATKQAMAEKQAETLRSAYDAIENLQAALAFLALSELRGFSHLEKVYAGAINPWTGEPFNAERDPWDVVELRVVEQWFWARNGYYGPWLYNGDARETNTGVAIDEADYVIRKIDDPVGPIFAEFGTKRRINDADWDGFLDDYGIPPQFIVLPPNIPKEREAEYQRAAELAISAARGTLPNGASLLSPTASGAGGAGVFRERLDYIDGQIVIAGTSGKLTILTESGSGTLAGEAQKDVFMDIAQAIANDVSGDMQRQHDKPLLARKHPREPILAYFEYKATDVKKSQSVLADAKTAGEAGYEMSEEELSEKSGYQLTKKVTEGNPQITQTAADLDKEDGTAAVPPSVTSVSSVVDEALKERVTVFARTRAPVVTVAQSLAVAPQFVAPGAAIIERLLAQAADDSLGVEDLMASAEELLQTLPELAAQASIDDVVDALQAAMRAAAEATLTGTN